MTTNEEAIAQYLLETPEFFHRHAGLIAKIQLTHPHSGRAISLADRQIELQREQNKILEMQYQQLLRVGRENVALAQKLHQWVLGLFNHPNDQALCESLQTLFDVPQAGIDRSQAAVDLAAQMQQPTCGLAAEAFFQNANLAKALPDANAANSMAVIPMPTLGLLVLASPDVNRFSPEMGTEFLTRLGQLAHAALD
jgi:uncharacterized protein YigA (DUF484 family)